MQKFRLVYLIAGLSLLLSGCGIFNNKKSSSQSSYTSSESQGKDWKDEADYSYTNRLPEVSSTISNIDDLMAVVDYHAFYRDTKSFDVQLNNYSYSTTQKTVDSEINYLYWHSELICGVIGISGKEKSSNTWTINFTYYHDNYIDSYPNKSMLKDLLYEEPVQTRPSSYNDFSTEPDGIKKVIDVATSQQLWYAAEWGYAVNPLPNTPAERIYNLAKGVLRQIIDNSMDTYQKITAIYDYIEHHASYCYAALDTPAPSDPKNYPDEYCARYKAFYIEGFFDNGTVVCDGYSKVYTLLGRMEGLDIYRAIGTSDKAWTSKEVAGHAYCYVKENSKYHLSCPTWGQNNVSNEKFVLNKTYFMSPAYYIQPYDSTMWSSFTFTEATNYTRYFQEKSFEYNSNTYSAFVTTGTSYTPYSSMILNGGKCFMNLAFESSELKTSFSNKMSAKGVKVVSTDNSQATFYKL